MSSILDALRKLEQEKVDVNRPIDVEYTEDIAERDLIGGAVLAGGPSGLRGVWLGVGIAVGVLALVAGSAGGAILWMRSHGTLEVGASTPSAPPIQTASVMPVTSPVPDPAPAAAASEPETSAVAEPPSPPVPAPTSTVNSAMDTAMAPVPFVPETSPRSAAAYTTVQERPAAPVRREPKEPSNARVTPTVKPPDVKPQIEVQDLTPGSATYEPVEVASTPLPDVPVERLLAPSGAPAAAPSSVVTPAPAEERAKIKVNMPRPANKTRPYDSAIINMQAVFLNEIIPGTNSRLVKVREDGVEVLNETTGQRHYIPL